MSEFLFENPVTIAVTGGCTNSGGSHHVDQRWIRSRPLLSAWLYSY